MTYRADIDGLRAVAVLSVILFHLDKALLPGGFVGVDIFFVISGYLISGNILAELAAGRFSLAEFYRRRVKRIAPAMLVVTAATVAAAQYLMLPEDARDATKSALMTIASVANVYFWWFQDQGYFARSSLEQPLLHMWSLGVEEQFYMLWPLCLMALVPRCSSRGLGWIMIAIALASFVLGSALLSSAPSFAYYMLPTRAGELLVGALAAHAARQGRGRHWSGGRRETVMVSGAILVLASLVLLDEGWPFPGLSAVPVTTGTALLLLAGGQGESRVARWLAWRPCTAIGLASYSAYLWHWPLMAFYRNGYGDPGPLACGALFIVTMLLAWLSYALVEQPARRARGTFLTALLRQFLLPGGVLALLIVLCLYPQRLGIEVGSERYARELARLRDELVPAFLIDEVCQHQAISGEDLRASRCMSGDGGAPRALLWGDSNAAQYHGVVQAIAARAGVALRNIEIGSCPPLLGDPSAHVEPRRAADCRTANALVLAELADYDVIILGAAWTYYDARSPGFLPAVFETVRKLSHHHHAVILLGKGPTLPGYDAKCRTKALRYPWLSCPAGPMPLQQEVTHMNRRLAELAASLPNVGYFDANDMLCPAGHCPLGGPDGVARYVDESHMSARTSKLLGARIVAEQGVPPGFRALLR